jgi:tetratricopeptide (TPR) repeat protein
VAEEL